MIRKASWYSSCAVATATACAIFSHASLAHAEEVSASPKGIVGGALLGGEVVMLTEAAIGVKPGWAYIVGGVLGAGAGGVGGYFVDQNADSKVSVYMLAGGLALIIPTTVAALQATSYKAPEDYTEDRPASGSPVPEPPRATPPGLQPAPGPGGTQSVPGSGAAGPTSLHYHWAPARLRLPVGLLDLEEGAFQVAMPAVEVRPVYRLEELQKYGLEQQHELRVPVFAATF
jgi:hypothetical protein